MVSKRSVENEGTVYLFAGEGFAASHLAKTEIEAALLSHRCGRVVGSGTSMATGTYLVEIVSRDPGAAQEAINDCISRLKVSDYEIVWD